MYFHEFQGPTANKPPPGDYQQPILIDDDGPVQRSDAQDQTNKKCQLCLKDATFLCSGCKKVWYCSSWCQVGSLLLLNNVTSQGERELLAVGIQYFRTNIEGEMNGCMNISESFILN